MLATEPACIPRTFPSPTTLKLPIPTPDALGALTPDERPLVAIYRDWLFKATEPYIPAQADALRRYQSQYLCMSHTHALKIPRERAVVLNNGGWGGRAREVAFKLSGRSPRLARTLRALRPVLLHAHMGQDGAVALPLARQLRIPLVVTFHGHDAMATDEALRRDQLRCRVFLRRREALKREGKLFIAVSEFTRGRLIERGWPEDKIVVHYIGVDTEIFLADPAVPREPVVFFAGRLIEFKGATHLIAAMREVRARVPEAELVIAGTGELRPHLEQQARESSVRARFLGRLTHEEVRGWMNRARVFCVPSMTAATGQTEAFGLVFAEAQAMGLPVVSFATGGIAEAVAHGETGLLAREGEREALAAHIETLLTDKSLWEQMSAAGMRRVRERFDLRRQAAALEDLYDRARGEAGHLT